jgi:transposase
LLAVEGLTAPQIAQRVERSRRFVQRGCYAYRDHGLDGLADKPRTGRPPQLDDAQQEAFKRRMLAGPTPADGVCTLRGVDAQRILEQEFGVNYCLNGVYALMHRLNLSCLKPRPRHRQSDPQTQQRWLDDAPFLSSTSAGSTPTSGSKSGSKMKPASGSKEG